MSLCDAAEGFDGAAKGCVFVEERHGAGGFFHDLTSNTNHRPSGGPLDTRLLGERHLLQEEEILEGEERGCCDKVRAETGPSRGQQCRVAVCRATVGSGGLGREKFGG